MLMFSFQINIDKLHILKTQLKKRMDKFWFSSLFFGNKFEKPAVGGSYLVAGLHMTWKDLTVF